jgi:hypothetical protein
MTKDAARRLRNNIRTVGLVGPALVWNRTTGTLISGHKRLAQLDLLEEGTDYKVDATVVEWPAKKEKRQNIFFNNEWAQGTFDLEMLGEMIAEDLSGLEGMGLDPVEIQTLFPDDDRFGDLFQDVEPELSTMPEVKATLDEIEAEKDAEVEANRAVRQAERQAGQAAEQSAEERAVEQAAAAADVKARRKELGAALDKANAADFYITIVAVDGDQAGAVLRAIGETDMGARFISAAKVLGALSAK